MVESVEVKREEISEIIYNFFSEECEVAMSEINDATDIIMDLDGDSLMFIELLEKVIQKYNLDIKLETIGKYLLNKPAETIGQVIDTTVLIQKYGNDIMNL